MPKFTVCPCDDRLCPLLPVAWCVCAVSAGTGGRCGRVQSPTLATPGVLCASGAQLLRALHPDVPFTVIRIVA